MARIMLFNFHILTQYRDDEHQQWWYDNIMAMVWFRNPLFYYGMWMWIFDLWFILNEMKEMVIGRRILDDND